MKRYKYQGLVTLAPHDGREAAGLPGPLCRMVVQARERESGRSRMFPALVSSDQGAPPGDCQLLVTLLLAGDNACDCLAPGEHFALWRDGHVGDGVVTRRLFV